MFERKLYRSDMLKCALCYDAPCTKACVKTDPAKLLRSIWFDNEKGAALALHEINPCTDCSTSCETACVRSGEVPIRSLIMRLYDDVCPNLELAAPGNEERLYTDFCGIEIENPFFLSSPLIQKWADNHYLSALKTISPFDPAIPC